MFFKFTFIKKKNQIKEKFKYKFDINNWMNLSKKERHEIDSKEKYESMIKKKHLLKSIRDEYIKLKKKK